MTKIKANKTSVDAKAYINAQINEIREKIRKAPDEETRQKLIETFNELTSSDEYQGNLAVVQEDTDIIREYAKRKKGGDITPEEFDAEKIDFYGKNMNLKFGEDFEKLDLGKKVDYIFEKFGDTDYAANLITELLAENHKSIVDILFDNYGRYNLSEGSCQTLFNKFGQGPVSLALIFGSDLKYYFKDNGQIFGNITESTLIHLAKLDQDFLKFRCIVHSCKDGSIGNHEILNLFIKGGGTIPFKKLSVEGQKYTINSLIRKGRYGLLFHSIYNPRNTYSVINNDIYLGENIDIANYIFKRLIIRVVKYGNKEFFTMTLQNFHKYYHKIIANILIQMGRVDIVKYFINCFTGLTEIEKAEILGNTEVEDKLNKKKFDSDLAQLQELGEKLGLTIKVEKKKEE